MPFRARVLVVDDSSTIRALLSGTLGKQPGIQIAGVAADAIEAERLLQSVPVDVVTLDVEMPGQSGIDYLRQIRGRHNVAVIMLSSSTGDGSDVRTRALEAGAAGCFNKADTVRELPQLLALIRAAANHNGKLTSIEAEALANARR